jgi:hypothetical protein
MCGAGLAASGEREKGKWASGGVGGLEEKMGRVGKKKGGRKGGGPRIAAGPLGLLGCGLEKKEGRERRERGVWEVFCFFSNLFKLIFQTFELNSFSNFKFKLILKLFKTTHYQTKKTCISNHDAQTLIASKIIQNDV